MLLRIVQVLLIHNVDIIANVKYSAANLRRVPQSEATGIENSRLLDSHAYSIQRDEVPVVPNYQTVGRT